MKTMMFAALLGAMLPGACLRAEAQAGPGLTIATETSAPFSMRVGENVAGIATDTIREILARAGIAHTIELLPWKRAYTLAQERPDACVYATTRTPERDAVFKWVGPIGEADWVLMGRADRTFSLRSLEDARNYRIGTYNGDARDEYLRGRGFEVDPAPDDLTNPRKLMLNRIDLWAASIQRGSLTLEQLGYAGKIVPVLSFKRMRLYLACNRAVPDAQIARMNEALMSMERDGSRRAILHKYDDWGHVRQR